MKVEVVIIGAGPAGLLLGRRDATALESPPDMRNVQRRIFSAGTKYRLLFGRQAAAPFLNVNSAGDLAAAGERIAESPTSSNG